MPVSKRVSYAFMVFTVFSEPLFWGPIIVLVIQQLGHMLLAEIYYMESVVVVLCTLIDAPFGALADVIGRKLVIIIGCLFKIAGVTLFAFMSSPLEVWTANVLLMFGQVMAAGADTALLHDALAHDGDSQNYRRIFGKANACRLYLASVTTLIAGALASYDLRLPLMLCIPFACVPLIAAFFMKDSGMTTQKYRVSAQWETLRDGARQIISIPVLRRVTLFSAFVCCGSMLWFFIYNPYFDAVGVPLAEVGIIFSLLNIVAGVSSNYAHAVEEKLGEWGSVVLMVACLGPPVLVMGLFPCAAASLLVICQNITRGMIQPFESGILNQYTNTATRATVSSFHSTGRRTIYAVALMGFGLIIDHAGLFQSLCILGTCSCALGLMFVQWFRKK